MSAQDIISSLQLALVILSGWDANPQQQQVWPVRFASKDNEILLYEPHAEKLIEDRLSLRAAFALYQEGTKDPAFGVCWMDTRIVSDRESRQARLTDLVLTQIRFPAGSDTATGTANRALVAELLEERTLDVSLDELLTTLEQDGIQDTGLKTDPPEIIFRTHPTVLVLLDGEARKMPVGEYGCQRIVNTPNLLLTDPEGSRYFLYGNDTWYESRSLDGNWTVSQKLPKAVRKTASAFEALPSGSLAPAAEDLSENFDRVGSDIILRTSPAELLLTDGAPDWRSVPETRLLYATNSQDHLFQYIPEQRYYVLISGRWFVSLALEQGWEYRAPDLLPEDFKRIPEDHPKAAVLPHVAGTAAAIEAVNDSRIPQTAVIERKTATCTVTFDGEPVFKPIEGTRMQYAINASEPVIRIDSNFYACENGVWYWGPAASGPWQAATAVPSEVKEIPPSCPLFPVRYVSIYGYTDDYIFTGYTPGYLGCYVFGPTVVFGTGWYYPGWWHRQYYPHPFTYGFNMHYDPWWGWTCGYSWAYGGTDAWLLWYWSPYPTIGWYHGWWGPYYRPPVYYHSAGDFHYGPRSRSMREVGPRSSYNLYRQGTNRISKDPGTVRRGITRNQAPRNVPNNVFAAPDGDVIRKSGSDWEKNNGRTWEKVPARPDVTPTRPAIPVNTPDRLEWQRNRSEQRNRIFQQTKPTGFPVPDMRSGGRPSKSIIVAPRK